MGKNRRGKGKRTSGSAPDRQAPVWMLSLVAASAVAGFAGSLTYSFVFDDRFQIVQNPWIRDWSNIVKILTSDVWAFYGANNVSNYYRPFHMLLYTAAYSIGGLQPFVFHLFSILVHAFCSVMVVLIGTRLTGSRNAGVAGGLLFALHPIHAESVAWIAGVTDPLCAAFYFPALYLYLKDGELAASDSRKKRRFFALACACFLGALFSKEMAFTFPMVAAWLDWCLYKKLRWLRYAGLAGIFAFYAMLRLLALRAFQVSQNPLDLSPFETLLSSIVLLAQYAAKMFIPYDMSAFHVFEPTRSVTSPIFILSLAWLAALGAIAWRLRKQRILLFLIGFGILTILPLLNITGIGENVFADRYLYIPTLGSCLLIPLCAISLVRIFPSPPAWLNAKTGAALLGLVLVVFAWKLWHEAAIWRDEPTLFSETIQRSPKAASLAHSLASYYYDNNELDKALEWELKAQKIWGGSFIQNRHLLALICSGLGLIQSKQGDIDEARKNLAKAYEIAPHSGMILLSHATFHFRLKEYDEALKYFEAVIQAEPQNEPAYTSASGIYVLLKNPDRAIPHAMKALELNPQSVGACGNMAMAYELKGMTEEAIRAYLRLKQIDPSQTDVADAHIRSLQKNR